MKIVIAERLHPFSHLPGTKFLLPKTSWAVQVFPTRLSFWDLEEMESAFSLTFDFQGPIKEFTAELNLERDALYVFGLTQKGYMRYELCSKENRLWLTMEKTPQEMVVCRKSAADDVIVLTQGKSVSLCASASNGGNLRSKERLSLGNHKAQDWDLMRRRLDCKEIFPPWFALSSAALPNQSNGSFSLLDTCKKKIDQGDKETVLDAFENLFLASFEGILVPRLKDTDHHGIAPEEENHGLSAMDLLRESGRLIRSLFLQEKEGTITLLPCLPTPFHCGRMIQAKTSNGAFLSFEWSKKMLKKVAIDSNFSGELRLKFPKGVRSFRLGKTSPVIPIDSNNEASISFEAGKTVWLDRFQRR